MVSLLLHGVVDKGGTTKEIMFIANVRAMDHKLNFKVKSESERPFFWQYR